MRSFIDAAFLLLAAAANVVFAESSSDELGHSDLYKSDFLDRNLDQTVFAQVCPDYTQYSRIKHKPYSEGPLELPYQRPHPQCRKFISPAVEKVIDDLYPRFKDRDLAQIFQNAFPNTLDTTVLWHVDGVENKAPKSKLRRDKDRWQGAQSFIVTGDINAEWLRDSANQLAGYQLLAKEASDISVLILGAINTQAEFVIQNPYCNAFQPPSVSGLAPSNNGQNDVVHPTYEPSVVFECKYELDSLANFLSVSNQYYDATKNTTFLTDRWFMALKTLLETLDDQAEPTFDPKTHRFMQNIYTFSRSTTTGTETLNLNGIGNPLNNGTGLIRSAFRPSDDATIFGYFIPANAMMSVQLQKTSEMLLEVASLTSTPQALSSTYTDIATTLLDRSKIIRKGIYDYAVVKHPQFGKVFAYEVDGYGSHLFMDDANVPSLLSLPYLGFVDVDDEIYQNTRKMILSPQGNPYFLSGPAFSGIGGPHIGLQNAWPMSVLMQAMTAISGSSKSTKTRSTEAEDREIMDCLDRVKNVSVFGLINESVDVVWGPGWNGNGMTRSWFAWANSVFAQTVLMLAEKKPYLLFGEGDSEEKGKKDIEGVKGYVVGKGWV